MSLIRMMKKIKLPGYLPIKFVDMIALYLVCAASQAIYLFWGNHPKLSAVQSPFISSLFLPYTFRIIEQLAKQKSDSYVALVDFLGVCLEPSILWFTVVFIFIIIYTCCAVSILSTFFYFLSI